MLLLENKFYDEKLISTTKYELHKKKVNSFLKISFIPL